MIWLTWRQFRASAATTAAALALLAAVFVVTGPALADEFSAGMAACTAQRGGPLPNTACMASGQEFFRNHRTAFRAVTALVLALPALVGLFWGAPLVTRELEAGTHLLVWNQSVTRTRWLAVKLGLVGLASMTAVGLGSLAVTWWASPIDQAAVMDFSRMEPLLFAARGVVPVGYAAFAFALGVTVGMLVRHTLPAMAITLAVFVAVQVAMPVLVRPYLLPPVHTTIEISESNSAGFKVERLGARRVTVYPGDTGAWFLSSRMVDASGNAVEFVDVPTSSGPCGTSQGPSPRQGGPRACLAEMTRLGYRLQVTYHPISRFWAFQWIETGISTALALGLAGCCFWRIRRDLA